MLEGVGPDLLPRDAVLVELRSDALVFETRTCVLPGTPLRFHLVMEDRPLPLEALTDQCLVVHRDRRGYIYNSRIPLDGLSGPDRQLIALFIAKGRGSPRIDARKPL